MHTIYQNCVPHAPFSPVPQSAQHDVLICFVALKVRIVKVVDHRVGVEIERDRNCVAKVALRSFLGLGERVPELIHAIPLDQQLRERLEVLQVLLLAQRKAALPQVPAHRKYAQQHRIVVL